MYYSRASILENQGTYDDFEATPGPENVFILEALPPAETLYFSVLAVNLDGEESEMFLEEVPVVFPPPVEEAPPVTEEPVVAPEEAPVKEAPAPEVEVEPAPEELPPPEPVRLLSAEVFSPTDLVLTFSQPVALGPGEGLTALRIADASDTPLVILSTIIQEERLIIQTETQERGKVYTVSVAEPLRGTNDAPLDQVVRTTTFEGHPEGFAPPEVTEAPVAPPVDVTQPRDVANLRLRAQQQANGLFTVVATWEYENQGELAHYLVRQSRDRGATAGPDQQLPIDVGGVQLQNVDPGPFGLAVSTVNIYGFRSKGVFQSIDLPGAPLKQPTPRVTAKVTPAPGEARAGRLVDSGGGLALLPVILTGMLLGWKRTRKT